MKAKQTNNRLKQPGNSVKRCLAANLSPPKDIIVKDLEYVCYDVRNYSWQVAPLQSLFPLHSGKTNIVRIESTSEK